MGRAGLAAVVALAVMAACAPAPAPAPSADRLLVLTDRDVEGIDPHLAGDMFQTDQLMANAYEGLVWRNADLGIEPALATSWSNPDDLTWDFELRAGVRFHDGQPLTAEDVAWSLDRARQRGTFRASLATITKVEVRGPRQVRVHTRQPDASLLSRLWKAWIVSRTFVQAEGEAALEQHSAGTGSYRIVRRQPGHSVELERVGSHWRHTPAFAHVTFLARAHGDADVPQGVPTIFWRQPGTPGFDAALRQADVHVRPGLSVSYVAFDLARRADSPGIRAAAPGNPFLDPRVRQAVAIAVDHERLRREAFGAEAVIPTQPISSAILGYDGSLPALAYDPAAARRLLAQTPWRDGFEVDLDVRQLMDRYTVPLVRDLGAIGIVVRPRVQSDEDFLARLAAGRSSFYVLRFSCRTGDAQEYLDKWVRSRDEAAGYGESNFSYRDDPVPGLDATIDRARAELVPDARLRLLQAAMREVAQAHLAVPLLCENTVTFSSRGLRITPRADAFRLAFEVGLAASPSR